jgi:hypothetical protein
MLAKHSKRSKRRPIAGDLINKRDNAYNLKPKHNSRVLNGYLGIEQDDCRREEGRGNLRIRI